MSSQRQYSQKQSNQKAFVSTYSPQTYLNVMQMQKLYNTKNDSKNLNYSNSISASPIGVKQSLNGRTFNSGVGKSAAVSSKNSFKLKINSQHGSANSTNLNSQVQFQAYQMPQTTTSAGVSNFDVRSDYHLINNESSHLQLRSFESPQNKGLSNQHSQQEWNSLQLKQ